MCHWLKGVKEQQNCKLPLSYDFYLTFWCGTSQQPLLKEKCQIHLFFSLRLKVDICLQCMCSTAFYKYVG